MVHRKAPVLLVLWVGAMALAIAVALGGGGSAVSAAHVNEWITPQYYTDSEASVASDESDESAESNESDESDLSFVDISTDERRTLSPFAPFPELEDYEPLPLDRDHKATETLRMMQLRGSLRDPVSSQTTTIGGATNSAAKGTTNTANGATNTANGAATTTTPTIRVQIKNDAPQPLPPGRQEISLLPGGERTFWILFTIIIIILAIVLIWCCRDIMLRPIVGCLEVSGYWLWRILSWLPFQLWEVLKIVVYPLKQGAFTISECCYAYLHPATKL